MAKPDIAIELDSIKPKKGLRPPMGSEPDMGDDEEEPSVDADPAEVSAFSALKAAFNSGDDEEGAKSLKAFIQLCGASDKEGY